MVPVGSHCVNCKRTERLRFLFSGYELRVSAVRQFSARSKTVINGFQNIDNPVLFLQGTNLLIWSIYHFPSFTKWHFLQKGNRSDTREKIPRSNHKRCLTETCLRTPCNVIWDLVKTVGICVEETTCRGKDFLENLVSIIYICVYI